MTNETRSLDYDYQNPTYHVHADVLPADAEDKSVNWASSDETIASVKPDATGARISLTGKTGLFNLTCTSVANPEASDTVACTVGIPIPTKGAVYNGSKVDPDDPTILDIHLNAVSNTNLWNAAITPLQEGHQYLIQYEIRYKPGATHVTGNGNVSAWNPGWYGNYIDYSKLSDDWQANNFTVKPNPKFLSQHLAFFSVTASAESDIQIRNLRITDVTGGGQVTAPEATDFGAYTWSQIGLYDGGTGIVNLTEEPGKDVYQYNDNKITFMRGHLYQVSLTTEGGSVSTHLDGYWDAGVPCPASADWKTSTATFTLPGTGEYSALICFYMPVTENGISMQMKDMRIDDLTLETGVGGGKPVSPTPRRFPYGRPA